MSTDDLTRRARAEVPTFALVSELADEVDRLRAEVDSKARDGRLRLRAMTAERDAARAALERVRDIVKGYYVLPYEAHFVVEEIRTELEKS